MARLHEPDGKAERPTLADALDQGRLTLIHLNHFDLIHLNHFDASVTVLKILFTFLYIDETEQYTSTHLPIFTQNLLNPHNDLDHFTFYTNKT